MVVFGSNCIVEWNNFKEIEETPSMMGKDESVKVVVAEEDVEEGEISDSASVEEISEEDFNKQDVAKEDTDNKESKPSKGGSDGRVWTMRDLYNYSGYRGYNSGLYNLAWAQAVQNKPLNDIFVMDVDPEENSKRTSSSPSVNSGREESNNAKEVEKVVIDDSSDEMDIAEKEEGELEEGEIDLDSEPVQKVAEEAKEFALNCDAMNVGELHIDSRNRELEKRVNCIREALMSVTVSVIDAEK